MLSKIGKYSVLKIVIELVKWYKTNLPIDMNSLIHIYNILLSIIGIEGNVGRYI